MAVRNYMHPRNIYRQPPNFKELAITYPEFRKYVKQELSGKVSIDFQDRKAVAELTKTLLLNDFKLDVDIDESRLIPRVPLCLNYILWIEDLLSVLNINDRVPFGIDIGTGSVCIYCLLASSKGWKMLATDVDEENIALAQKNIIKNKLENQIVIKSVKDFDNLLLNVLDTDQSYDFCMCNPPFFNPYEKPVSRTPRRKEILSVASDVDTEIATYGGEVEFIKKLIKESQILKDKIKIYTTLVGKKNDFLTLQEEIRKTSPKSFLTTEFCQGRTTRWGIAWSYSDINLEKEISEQKSKKNKNKGKTALRHVIENKKLDDVVPKIKKLLEDLKLQFNDESTDQANLALKVAAYENTWSNQRRKRRENKKKEEAEESKFENEESCLPSKKMKIEEEKKDDALPKSSIVEFLILITQDNNSVVLELPWLSGNKEFIFQILQYFKNKGIDEKTSVSKE